MPTPVSPTTEIQAVNTMLEMIGEAPVSTLVPPVAQSVAVAQRILGTVSREVQARGWNFNTDLDVIFSPAAITNEIALPSDVVRFTNFRSRSGSRRINLTERNRKVYDRINNTFEFTEDIRLDLTHLLDITELPEPARYYILIRAGRQLAERLLGEQTSAVWSSRDELDAKRDLENWDGDVAGYNYLGSPDMIRFFQRAPGGGSRRR